VPESPALSGDQKGATHQVKGVPDTNVLVSRLPPSDESHRVGALLCFTKMAGIAVVGCGLIIAGFRPVTGA